MDRPNSLPDSGTPAAASQPRWDVKQAAEYLKVSESWIRRHLSELPYSRHGRLIRFDPEGLKRTVEDRKSLEPRKATMPINRYQRGGVYLRGKKKMWYGTYRLDTPEGRRSVNIPLGTTKELPTKAAARKKLAEKIDEMTKPNAVPDRKKKFSQLVAEWKETEGVTLGRSTLKHYSDALQSYVLPTFKDKDIRTINRKSIQDLLTAKARTHSESSLKSMRIVLRMVLAWAERNGDIQQPNGWLEGIRLPRETFHGREVVRTELEPEQTLAIMGRLKEPYATLVLFLATLGRRIEEAVGLQPGDLDEANVLTIRRVIYNSEAVPLKEDEVQVLPLDAVVHADLIRRLRALGAGQKWVFQSRTGTPVNTGNALRRYLHPATRAVGVRIGGWHDFRHTITRKMRRAGVHPIVVRDTLGHKQVKQQEAYDVAKSNEVGNALSLVGKQLLPTVLPNQSVN